MDEYIIEKVIIRMVGFTLTDKMVLCDYKGKCCCSMKRVNRAVWALIL